MKSNREIKRFDTIEDLIACREARRIATERLTEAYKAMGIL